jgi:hypothetical protein
VVVTVLPVFCFSVYSLFFVIQAVVHWVQWRKLLLLCHLASNPPPITLHVISFILQIKKKHFILQTS